MRNRLTIWFLIIGIIMMPFMMKGAIRNIPGEISEAVIKATEVAEYQLQAELIDILGNNDSMIKAAVHHIKQFEEIHRVTVVSEKEHLSIEKDIIDLFIQAQERSPAERANLMGKALYLESSYVPVNEVINLSDNR